MKITLQRREQAVHSRNFTTNILISYLVIQESSNSRLLGHNNININMEQVIKQLEGHPNYREQLKLTCKDNKISSKILKGLTITKVRAIFSRTRRHYDLQSEKAKTMWFQNELRLFHWILLIQSYLLELPLKSFKTQHWQQINLLFPPKHPNMLEFQSRKFLSANVVEHPRSWKTQECQLLLNILKDQALINRWNEVSRLIYDLSDKKYFKSSKQCREQWFNHLDNSKKHGQWQQQQDIQLLQAALTNGHAWAFICRTYFPHRTQHMVKNRYKSLISKVQRNHSTNERKLIRKMLIKIKSKTDQGLRENSGNQLNSNKIEVKNNFLYNQSQNKEQFVDYSIINQKITQGQKKMQIMAQNILNNHGQTFEMFPQINHSVNQFHNIYNLNTMFCIFDQPITQFIYPSNAPNFYVLPMNLCQNLSQLIIQ